MTRLQWNRLASVTTLAILLSSCGGQLAIPSAPVALDTAEQTLEGASVKALGILESAGYVVRDAQLLELQLACRQVVDGLEQVVAGCSVVIPSNIHEQVKAQFLIVSRAARTAIADIRAGVVDSWPALRERLNPILTQAEALARLVQQGVGEIRAGGLSAFLGTLTQIIQSAVALIPPQTAALAR